MARTKKHGITDCRRIFYPKTTTNAKRKGHRHNGGARNFKKAFPLDYFPGLWWKIDNTRREL